MERPLYRRGPAAPRRAGGAQPLTTSPLHGVARRHDVIERLAAPVPLRDRAPETLALGLDGGQEGRLVHASGLAAVDEHLAVDDDRLDVATRAALDERLDGVVDGTVVRLEQVDDDDVGPRAPPHSAEDVAAQPARPTEPCGA